LVKGGKAYLIKAHQERERERVTPLTVKQGKIRKKQVVLVNNGMVDMVRQMEAMCFDSLMVQFLGNKILQMGMCDPNWIFVKLPCKFCNKHILRSFILFLSFRQIGCEMNNCDGWPSKGIPLKQWGL
jgi:hypothetical protein